MARSQTNTQKNTQKHVEHQDATDIQKQKKTFFVCFSAILKLSKKSFKYTSWLAEWVR